MTAYAELAATTNFSFLRGASHPQEMVGDRGGARPCRHRHRRPQQLRRRGACLRRSEETKSRQASRRHPARDARRFRNPRLSDRSGGVWPALPPSDEGRSRGEQRRMPDRLRGGARRERGPDAHRLAAGRAGFEIHRTARPPGAPAPGCVFLAGSIAIAATNRAVSAFSPSSAKAWAPHSSPSTTSITTRPSAGRFSTSSPASARMHPRRGRLSPDGRCRASSQAARRDGAALRRLRGGTRTQPAHRRGLPLLARRTQIRISGRARAAGQDGREHLADLTFEGAQKRYPEDKYPFGVPEEIRKALRRGTRPHRQARIRALLPRRP